MSHAVDLGHHLFTTPSADRSHLVTHRGLDALGRLYSNNPDSGFWVRVVDYHAEDRLPALARECVALGEVTYPIREATS